MLRKNINSYKSSEDKNKEINSEGNNISNSGEANKKVKLNDSSINNMIILKSGNIALSRKEVIEIYNLQNLNFSDDINHYYNDHIRNNCLIQQIKLVSNKNINYVFQLYDQTLLCSTYGIIYRIKLKDNDTTYEIYGYLELLNHELPTKIISLENQFLVILSERDKHILLKLYKNNNIINNELNNNNLKNKNDCNDILKEGNFRNFNKEKIYEDNSFELVIKNFNEKITYLWVSIYPIEKNKNKYEKYLYEFIATSNHHFDKGSDIIVFFGLLKDRNNKYKVEQIKEITGISCSIMADSICKINEKFICIGLQNKKLNGQQSGFALIDIYKREINKIIKDDNICSICYDINNKILLASVEKWNNKEKKYATKIYEIKNGKDDKGNEAIDFNGIAEYKSKHIDEISSIHLLYNARKERIFITASLDSTLEVVKTEI